MVSLNIPRCVYLQLLQKKKTIFFADSLFYYVECVYLCQGIYSFG